jgi:hypothetical protein
VKLGWPRVSTRPGARRCLVDKLERGQRNCPPRRGKLAEEPPSRPRPFDYRPRRQGGQTYVVHREDLPKNAVTHHEGIPIVTPAVAIRQAIDTGVPRQLVRQAIETARRLGRVPTKSLNALARHLKAAT